VLYVQTTSILPWKEQIMTTERSNEPVGFDAFLGDNSASAASVPEPEHDATQTNEPEPAVQPTPEAPEPEPPAEDDESTEDEESFDPVQDYYEKKLESARVAPPGVPIPTIGPLAKTRFWLWEQGWYGRDFVVPPLSKKEHRIYQYKLAETELLVEDLKSHIAQLHLVLTVLNSKGGAGKTAIAAYVATVLDWAIELLVVLMDVNQFDGTTAALMGMSRRKTKNLRYVADHLNEFRTYHDLTTHLGRSMMPGNRVHLVASSPGSMDFELEEVVKTEYVLGQSAKAIVNDGGNGHSDRLPANMGAVIASTDLLFAALAGEKEKETIERVISTMANVGGDGFIDKVRRSFIVVSATRPQDTKSDLMFALQRSVKELKRDDLSEKAQDVLPQGELDLEFFGIVPERVHMIPYDQYIADKKPAHAPSMYIDTRNATLKLLVDIAKQASPEPDLPQVLRDFYKNNDAQPRPDQPSNANLQLTATAGGSH
jgi:MinD-like ATPase involved in chromosome partitioning or flagellar assembly